MASQAPPPRPSFAPHNWGGWLLVAFLWVLGQLPVTLGRWLVAPLAPLLRLGLSSRRKVAERNLQACFPDLDEAERERLLRASFSSLARMVAEMAWCWTGNGRKIQRMGRYEGAEHVQAAAREGKGVLVVTAHLACLEAGGRLLTDVVPGGAVYRPLRNEVMEWYQNRGRLQYADVMISKRDTRGMLRYLKSGGCIWYAPDQDFGSSQSAFAPFFGINTASLLATHRLPKMTGCAVVPMFPRWDASTGEYVIEILPALDNFPSEDPVADLARVNAILEAHVRKYPEQYWWIHRRFKTRPEGEPPFYG